MPENTVMQFDGNAPSEPRRPRAVYQVGSEPDPLYSLANERTYVSWLRLAVTLLAGAVAIDRLYLQHRSTTSELLSLALVVVGYGVVALGVRRWWSTERALRLRSPMPGFGAPILAAVALILVACGVLVRVLDPSA